MGIFDKNIHMNGSGTSYQAFLDLADAAAKNDQAIGDKGALAAESALVRESKMEFDIAVGFVRTQREDRMGVTKSELDRGKIQAEALKLIREGKFPNNKDGLKAASRA